MSDWLPEIRRRLSAAGLDPAREAEIAQELDQHLSDRYDEMRALGAGEDDARQAALAELADDPRMRRELAGVEGRASKAPPPGEPGPRALLSSVAQDIRYGLRSLRLAPSFTAVIVLTLALGIGANAIMFGVVDQMLLRAPAQVAEPATVRRIYFGTNAPAQPGRSHSAAPANSYPVVAAIRDTVSAYGAASATHRTQVTLGAGAGARAAEAELVNAAYFSLLGLRPATGRFFTPAEDGVPAAAPVVVLSHRFWTREFGAAPSAIGQALRVEGELLTVVGVGPEGFSGTDRRAVDFWVPVGALGHRLLGPHWPSNHGRYAFGLVARLASGVSSAIADEQATAAYRRALASADLPPMMQDPLATAFAVPLNGLRAPNGLALEGRVGLWLLGVSALLLLIAGANVAQLLLTRTLARRRELAVRLALGASRGRIARQLLTESALLATLAAVAALGVAHTGSRVLRQVLLPSFAWDASAVDGRVIAVILGMTVLMALATGFAPAIQCLDDDGLRRGGPVTRGRAGMFQTGLLVAQAALCVLLLVGAGLFVKSLHAVRGLDVGIDLERVIEASLPARPAAAAAEASALYAAGLERLAGVPGVERVAMTYRSSPVAIGLDDVPAQQQGRRIVATLTVVTAGYFATIGATLEGGRDLAPDDDRRRARVAVINRALAREAWPGGDPLGRCVQLGSDAHCTAVIGIVENVLLDSRTEIEQGRLYVLSSHPFGAGRPTALLVRARSEARPLVPIVRDVLQSLTPEMPFVPVETVEARTATQLRPWRLGTSMFLAFGAVALFIAAVGLYSAIAHAVAQRTHEIGIRMALGASRWRVIALVGAHGTATILGGVVIGLLLSAAATRWLTDVLYETSPRDPVVFGTVAAVLVIAGMLAAVLPARRATRVNPLDALRTT